MIKQGYKPIIMPNRGRGGKYYRRKDRKIFNDPRIKLEQKYRRRGIGEISLAL